MMPVFSKEVVDLERIDGCQEEQTWKCDAGQRGWLWLELIEALYPS